MAAFWSIFFFHACLILLCLLLVFYINIRDDAYLDRHLSTCAIVMIYISLHNMASQGSWDFHFMTKCLTRHQSCILRHNHHQHVSTLLHELNQSSLHLLSKKLSLWLSIQIVESIIIGKMLRKYMPLWFMCRLLCTKVKKLPFGHQLVLRLHLISGNVTSVDKHPGSDALQFLRCILLDLNWSKQSDEMGELEIAMMREVSWLVMSTIILLMLLRGWYFWVKIFMVPFDKLE